MFTDMGLGLPAFVMFGVETVNDVCIRMTFRQQHGLEPAAICCAQHMVHFHQGRFYLSCGCSQKRRFACDHSYKQSMTRFCGRFKVVFSRCVAG